MADVHLPVLYCGCKSVKKEISKGNGCPLYDRCNIQEVDLFIELKFLMLGDLV